MTTPTIHLNGDSAETLVKGYTEAYRAVQAAIDALQKTAPNGRNYYPQGAQALDKAQIEHYMRVNRLEEMANELLGLAHHCSLHTREARTA